MPEDEPDLHKTCEPPRGTFNLWVDCAKSRDAFEPGIRQRWGEFQFGRETCVVCSDGPVLAATIGGGNRRPLFEVPLALPRTRRRHLITIGWSKGRMKVLLDSKLIAEVPVTFILWFAFVSGVLCSASASAGGHSHSVPKSEHYQSLTRHAPGGTVRQLSPP